LGISERKQRQKEQVRHTILEAAWQIVLSQGWSSLSVRSIADAIEYSTPVIYSHFAAKENLLQEFYRQGFQLLGEHLAEVSSNYEDPDEKIHAVAIAYWDFAFKHKEFYQLMFGVNIECCYKAEIVTEEKKEVLELFEKMIVEALSRNKNDLADPSLKRSTFWCILHGLVAINITGRGRILKEEGKMERVLDDAIKGFIKSLKP
jgi:AcrR family transcriptional regulator